MAPPTAGCKPGEPCATPGNERTTAVVVGVRDAAGVQDWNLVTVTLTSKTAAGNALTGIGPSGSNRWGAAFRFPSVVEGDYILEAIGRGAGGAVTGAVRQDITVRLVPGKDQFLNVTLVPVAPPPGTIEFVDKDFNVLSEVRYGLWDNAGAHGKSGIELLNEEDDDRNFVGGDTRRFFVLVKDPAPAPGSAWSVQWWTADSASATPTNGPTLLTVSAVPGRSGQFVSKAVMLVNNVADLVDTHDGYSGPVAPGTTNYRIKMANLSQRVFVSYGSGSSASSASAPVFQKLKKLQIRVHVQRDASGTPCRPSAEVFADIERAAEVFGRFGVMLYTFVTTATAGKLGAKVVTSGARDYVEIDLSSYVNAKGQFDQGASERAVTDHFSDKGAFLDVFYATDIGEGSGIEGISYTIPRNGIQDKGIPEILNGTTRVRASVDANTLAHELMHHIGNKEKTVMIPDPIFGPQPYKISHFLEPSPVTSVGGRLLKELCIISEGSAMTKEKGALGSVRLWDGPDADVFFWVSAALKSSYLEDVP